MEKEIEKTFNSIAETFKENLKTHKEFYKNFKDIGEIIACARPQFKLIQKEIEVLKTTVESNKKSIDKRETQLGMLSIIIKKAAPSLPTVLRWIAIFIGLNLFINVSILVMKSIKIWEVF